MAVTERAAALAIGLAEEGRLPDPLIRMGIRRLLGSRLRSLEAEDGRREDRDPTVGESGGAAARIAIETDAANRQHYEVPASFFRLVLGRHLKYSCCAWRGATHGGGAEGPYDAEDLDDAELRMLELTIERADLASGQRVLDLGCGWGSFSLHAAAAYPGSDFLVVSNSRGQIDFVRSEAEARGLGNLGAVVADVNDFDPGGRFDRIVSIEMMEHVRDHVELLRRIAEWLKPEGRIFVHVFCHRSHAYAFEADGPADWMARRFFTGGMMPSATTIPDACRGILETERRWRISGLEYARTAEAWLKNLDANRADLASILGDAGEPDPDLALQRWRLFFLAVRETFGYRAGSEWQVGHYRLRPAKESVGGT